MKKYCFDTSGITNPLETMPEDIYTALWAQFSGFVASGAIAITSEILDELLYIEGDLGEVLAAHKNSMLLEIEDSTWDWKAYVNILNKMLAAHHDVIKEYSGGSPKTICLIDMTIIAQAKVLEVPVVSMEKSTGTSETKKKIPDICALEGVEHITFNDFLRAEGFVL